MQAYKAYIGELVFWVGDRPLLHRSLKLKVDIGGQKSRLPPTITESTTSNITGAAKEYIISLMRIISTTMPLWYLYVLSTGQVSYAEPYNAFSIVKHMTNYVFCAILVNWMALQNILSSSSKVILANICLTANMLEKVFILFRVGFNKLAVVALLLEFGHYYFHDVMSWGHGTYAPFLLGAKTAKPTAKPKGKREIENINEKIGSKTSTKKFNFNDAFSYICDSNTMQLPFTYLSAPWILAYMLWVTTAALYMTYDFDLNWCQGFWMIMSFFVPVYEAVKTGDCRRWGSLRIVILAWMFFVSDLMVCYTGFSYYKRA